MEDFDGAFHEDFEACLGQNTSVPFREQREKVQYVSMLKHDMSANTIELDLACHLRPDFLVVLRFAQHATSR